MNVERIAVLHTTGGVLYKSTIEYGFDQYKQEESPALDDRIGAGNWVALLASDLPSDFSVDTYTIKDGELVRLSAEVIAEREAAALRAAEQAATAVEIARLKEYLTATDWAVVKCLEIGTPLAKAYPELATRRIEARARINELEQQITKQSN